MKPFYMPYHYIIVKKLPVPARSRILDVVRDALHLGQLIGEFLFSQFDHVVIVRDCRALSVAAIRALVMSGLADNVRGHTGEQRRLRRNLKRLVQIFRLQGE